MPRSPEQNAIIRDKRRTKILDKTLKLYALEGFDAIAVDDITHATNCSHGLFYHYFNDKEDVYNALLEYEGIKYAQFALPLEEAEKLGGLKGIELIAKHFEGLVGAPDGAFYFAKLHCCEEFKMNRADAKVKKIGLCPRLVKLIEAGQKAGEIKAGDPEELAHAFIDLANGAVERRIYSAAAKEVAIKAELLLSVLKK